VLLGKQQAQLDNCLQWQGQTDRDSCCSTAMLAMEAMLDVRFCLGCCIGCLESYSRQLWSLAYHPRGHGTRDAAMAGLILLIFWHPAHRSPAIILLFVSCSVEFGSILVWFYMCDRTNIFGSQKRYCRQQQPTAHNGCALQCS